MGRLGRGTLPVVARTAAARRLINAAVRSAGAGDIDRALSWAREGARRLSALHPLAHGPSRQEVVVALHVLADRQLEQVSLGGALETLDQAYALGSLDGEPTLLAETLVRRGNAHRLAADHDRARADLVESVHRSGSDSIARLMALNALGILCKDTGRLEEAAHHYAAAQALQSARFPQEYRIAADLLHNRAGLAHARGDHDEGERLIRRAIEVRGTGPGRGDTAGLLGDQGVLGAALSAQGRRAEAEALFIDLAAAWTAARGPGHYEVAFCRRHLGRLREQQGDIQGALTHYRTSLAVTRSVLGPQHPEVRAIEADLHRLEQDTDT